MKDKKSSSRIVRETNPAALKSAVMRKVHRHADASGVFRLSCAPSLAGEHARTLNAVFEQLGRPFSDAELQNLERALAKHAEEGFKASPHSRVVVRYKTRPVPHPGIEYAIETDVSTIGDEYQRWVDEREPPLFGTHPDAKLMHLAAELGAPADVPILDVGAGTGRNTLPLARLGHPTDAVEIAPALASILREAVAKENLSVGVYEGDLFDRSMPLPLGKYKVIVLAEVVSHFRDYAQVRQLTERASELLAPGGVLLFSSFVATDGYKPDMLAREFSQVMWSTLFTRQEIDRAIEGLPLVRITDESVFDFEHEHLPPEAWPPTGWFVSWSRGYNLFPLVVGRPPPMELRWFSFRKR